MSADNDRGLGIVGLNYVSFYFDDLDAAVDFYTRVLGPPDEVCLLYTSPSPRDA